MIADLSRKHSTLVIASVMLGLFLGAMEATVVATALPTIVSQLSGLSLYSWPMAIYILASAVTGPLFGKISDLYGRRKLYLFSLTIFLIGSVLSGMSNTMLQLVCARALQGLGAGGVLPLSIIIAGDMFPGEKRAKVQPLFSIVWGIASLVGPPLGAWLTSYSWRLVFLVNVPFGIVSGLLVSFFLKETLDHKRSIAVDYLGAFLLTIGLLAFQVGLPQEGGFLTIPFWRSVLLTVSLISILLFVIHERTAKEPILPLSLMQYRIFSSASLCQFFSGVALFGSLSFIPLYIEGVVGSGIHGTGKILSWLLLSWVFFSFLSSRMMLKQGYRFLVVTGTFLLTAGFATLRNVTESGSSGGLLLAVILLGAGMGWIMAPLIVAVQNGVPRKDLGAATSSQVLFRTTGASLGVSVMGSVLASKMAQSLKLSLPLVHDPTIRSKLIEVFQDPKQVMDPFLRAQVPPEVLWSAKSMLAFSLHSVFTVALIGASVAFLVSFLVPPGKAQDHFIREESR